MRILLLVHSFNSLAQRLYVELIERGHQVSVEFDINDAVDARGGRVVRSGYRACRVPQARNIRGRLAGSALPDCSSRHHRRPRAVGARLGGARTVEREWGVTVLEAEAELDAGPVWASAAFPMRAATKSSLYRREVTDAAVEAVLAAIARIQSGTFVPRRPDHGRSACTGTHATSLPAERPRHRLDERHDRNRAAKDCSAPTAHRACATNCLAAPVRLYDAHRVDDLAGSPGAHRRALRWRARALDA